MNPLIKEISLKALKKDLPKIQVGDTVKVTVVIKEGSKERNQNYEGVILKMKGVGINKTFTVRRVFQGVGVERVFFLNSPKIVQVKIIRRGKTRRAKLYFLRERTGKSTKLREKMEGFSEEADSIKEMIPEEGKLVEAG
ncbi:MAG: 50S ribosomal protein L19 [Candidatus Melainabacteria bacterium]|nr:50S ribosomal protein L19 [Candidatus Melainabacteria bacterium]